MYAESTSPRSDGEPVKTMTAKASAIGANALPNSEIVRPRKSRRKSRSASGPNGSLPTSCLSRRVAVIVPLGGAVTRVGEHGTLDGVYFRHDDLRGGGFMARWGELSCRAN